MAESTKIPLISLSVPTAGGGFVQLAVWENEQQKDGEEFTTHSCTLQRRYRDGDDWKSTHSFRAGDLLTISFAAQEAYRQFMEARHKQ